jgi:hypothetical protein
MIIKVPIYVEIESIDSGLLAHAIESFTQDFQSILRKEKFIKSRSVYSESEGFEGIAKFKIITKEKALEILRTKK